MRKSRIYVTSENQDYEEKLIADSVYELRNVNIKTIYCFSEYQAKEISTRCKLNCEVIKVSEDLYIINKIK